MAKLFATLCSTRSEVAVFERIGGGSLDHLAVDAEAGSVAGAVPGVFGVVERDDAAQVGTGGGDGGQQTGLVAVDGAAFAADPHHRAAAGCEVGGRIGVGGRPYPVAEEVPCDCEVGFEERGGLNGRVDPARVVDRGPGRLLSVE